MAFDIPGWMSAMSPHLTMRWYMCVTMDCHTRELCKGM